MRNEEFTNLIYGLTPHSPFSSFLVPPSAFRFLITPRFYLNGPA
jgi:hypothetical protein